MQAHVRQKLVSPSKQLTASFAQCHRKNTMANGGIKKFLDSQSQAPSRAKSLSFDKTSEKDSYFACVATIDVARSRPDADGTVAVV